MEGFKLTKNYIINYNFKQSKNIKIALKENQKEIQKLTMKIKKIKSDVSFKN